MGSTPLGTNTTNGTKLPSDSIPVGTKLPKPTSPALPTDLPGDLDPDPSLSDSSKNYNSSTDTNSIKSKKEKRDKKKNHRKDKKDNSLDPSSSDDSDLSYGIDYRRKLRKRKSDREKDPIKLCAHLTAKFLTIAYKSKSSSSNWMRIRSNAVFIFSYLWNHWR